MTGRALLLAGALAAAAHAGAAAPVHHDLEVRLDPVARLLAAVDRIRLAGVRPKAFALGAGFVVDRLVVDGAPVEVAGPGPWPLALDERPVHEVLVGYHGRLAALDPDAELGPPAAAAEGAVLVGGWYPTLDAGPFGYTLAVAVPPGQRAVAAGRLLGETTTPEGEIVARFAGEAPVEELALFAGPWVVEERRHRGRRLRTYFHEEEAGLAADYLARTAEYLDLYEGWIGAYPYAGFAVVSSPLGVGLGFPGLAYLGRRVLRLPFILDTSLGHEVLHAWWGNAVAVTAGEGNWAEGLTTFMADHASAERRSAEEARQQRLAWLREYAVLPRAEDRPLAAFTERRHGAARVIGYHKAAMVFLMLRDALGPATFDAAIRDFWARHRFASAGWTDLRRAFERASGRRLGRFFAHWVRRAGAPVLTLADVRAARGRVSLALRQSAPPFPLAVSVTAATPAGPVTRWIALETSEARAALAVPAPPTAVEVDPDVRVFRRLHPEEVPPILRDVAFDPRAVAALAVADEEARAAAAEAAARLLGRRPALVEAPAAAPLLVVGTDREVEALLARAGLPGVPASLAGRGTGRAWAARAAPRPLVVVQAADSEALRVLSRPLPHHGGQSWLVFEGARAAARGLWQPARSPLRVELAR